LINSIFRFSGAYSTSAFKGKTNNKNSGSIILKSWNRSSKSSQSKQIDWEYSWMHSGKIVSRDFRCGKWTRLCSFHWFNHSQSLTIDLNSKNKNIRDLYRGITEFKKGYQPKTNLVNDERGDLLANPLKILTRWKNYLCQLLNVCGIRQTDSHSRA
jgi:hypothetical protein